MPSALVRFLFGPLLVVCALGAVSGVCAQKPKPSPSPTPAGEQTPESVKIPIRRVRLPITVVDKKGQFVPGLTKEDFMILEDKVPQQIETFLVHLMTRLPCCKTSRTSSTSWIGQFLESRKWVHRLHFSTRSGSFAM